LDLDNENEDTIIFSQENKHLEGEAFLKKKEKKKFIWKSQPLTQKVLYLYFTVSITMIFLNALNIIY